MRMTWLLEHGLAAFVYSLFNPLRSLVTLLLTLQDPLD
jgi:hypothetical protein